MAILQPLVMRVAIQVLVVVALWTASGRGAWAQGEEGWSLDRHCVILGADSDRVYLGVAPLDVSLREAVRETWQVFSAPRLGGDMVEERVRPLQVEAWNVLEGIQHVAMHPEGGMALISARRTGDDLDLFVSHKSKTRVPGGRDTWSLPMPLDGLNTKADEVFPQWRGRDIAFASNRNGDFALFTSRAATQWLRAELFTEFGEGNGDVLSAVTVGPAWTWLSRRTDEGTSVEVVRVPWPLPQQTLQGGWTLCVLAEGEGAAEQVVAVRDPRTRDVTRLLRTDERGCVSLDGLPSDRAWTFQWQREASAGTWPNAVAEVRAPDGRVVRRYDLTAASGWEFVFLPLDPVAEIQDRLGQDRSTWPSLTLAVLSYDHGLRTPTSDSWKAFLEWAEALPVGQLLVTGHTDASGTDEINAALSWARAQHVATQLTGAFQWPQDRLEVRAEGSTQPFSQDPAQNRRVEVRWVPAMQ
jgi:hypothetical protein